MKNTLYLLLLALNLTLFAQQAIVHELEIDLCDPDANNKAFQSKLQSFKINKGDFIVLKVVNLNPYLYDVKLTTRHDTIKVGHEPALIAQFMNPSMLGELVGGLLTETVEAKEENEDSIKKTLKTLNASELIDDITNTNSLDKTKIRNEINQKPINQKEKENFSKILIQKGEENQELSKKLDALIKVRKMASKIDSIYSKINECYYGSIRNTILSNIECYQTVNCYDKIDCNCLKDSILPNISKVSKQRVDFFILIDSLLVNGNNSDEEKGFLKKIQKELDNEKYNPNYLNQVYLKALSNFILANNVTKFTTYNSYPIQIMGDYFDLKVDITSKKNDIQEKKEDEEEKESKPDSSNKVAINNTNKVDNSSPITINLNLKEGKVEAEKTEEKEKEKSSEKEEHKPINFISADELKLAAPKAVKEVHLHYRYRATHNFYGFSAGFFIDGLEDQHYTNKRINPLDSVPRYRVVKERNRRPFQFGITASVNAGFYLDKATNSFVQIFMGPGLTAESKPQPRLLLGLGFGKGAGNKLSINLGASIGQVQRLSSSVDTEQEYSEVQSNLHYKSNGISPFFSLSYIFDWRNSEEPKEKE